MVSGLGEGRGGAASGRGTGGIQAGRVSLISKRQRSAGVMHLQGGRRPPGVAAEGFSEILLLSRGRLFFFFFCPKITEHTHERGKKKKTEQQADLISSLAHLLHPAAHPSHHYALRGWMIHLPPSSPPFLLSISFTPPPHTYPRALLRQPSPAIFTPHTSVAALIQPQTGCWLDG